MTVAQNLHAVAIAQHAWQSGTDPTARSLRLTTPNDTANKFIVARPWAKTRAEGRTMNSNIRDIFPAAATNRSRGVPREQRFTVAAGATITIITFYSEIGNVPHAGIVIEQGEFFAGYFQRRGYVGNSLKDGRIINPINITTGIYDLTLDNVITSFSYSPQAWSKVGN